MAACTVLIIGGKPVTVCDLPGKMPGRCDYVQMCEGGKCRAVEVCR